LRTLEEWLTLQESVHPKTIDMGLARVSSVAQTLGVDKPACPVITVAGTNGKGSTVVHLDALLRAGGASAGMFTSPHFVRYNERIRVNGVDVGDDEIVAAFERSERARGTTTLTFFEFNALAALIIFADRKVDVAVLEVGLGGRLDAVNLVDADVAVVCSVGFDHRDYLGDTLDLIGAEKAGIFRTFRPAVLGTDEMPASVYGAIASLKAQPVVAGRDFTWKVDSGGGDSGGARWEYNGLVHGSSDRAASEGIPSGDGQRLSLRNLPPSALTGSIQYRNASTALAAIESLQAMSVAPGKRGLPAVELNERTVSEALRGVRLAGRFQVVQGPGAAEWILDIAHNEPAAAIFARHVRERPMPAPGAGRTYAVVGILGDKDAKSIATFVEPLVDHWILCALPGPRGTSAEQLAERLQLPATKVTLTASIEAGCEVARKSTREGDRVLVFGSFHTVGPVLQWLGIY
jgi:dihydrofolate synthase / folylpolyglutamate synthase